MVAAALAASATYLFHGSGPSEFVPGAEERVESRLVKNLMGQPLAVQQVSDAITEHLSNPSPKKPLVISVHGPPGVGKSLFHLLLAHALYNVTEDLLKPTNCPGRGCPAYKVVFGLDYLQKEKERQVDLLRDALVSHIMWYPKSLLVMEEYDKVDCDVRGLLRQLLDKGTESNLEWGRSIVVMEANTGYLELLNLLEKYTSRSDMHPEDAQKILKDMLFSRWVNQGCEERVDTMKSVSLIDMFVPFLPLERENVEDIIDLNLQRRRQHRIGRGEMVDLKWDKSTIEFLSSKIEFDGLYAIEGAKEVGTVLARYVTRALKHFARSSSKENLSTIYLGVAQDNKGLLAQEMQP